MKQYFPVPYPITYASLMSTRSLLALSIEQRERRSLAHCLQYHGRPSQVLRPTVFVGKLFQNWCLKLYNPGIFTWKTGSVRGLVAAFVVSALSRNCLHTLEDMQLSPVLRRIIKQKNSHASYVEQNIGMAYHADGNPLLIIIRVATLA